MQLGDVLKKKREELSLTQEEVGDKLFVTRQTISNWENKKTLPDIDSLIDIATFYDLSLDNLLLKGSDVVEDIKRKEKIASLYKWTLVPFITFGLLLLLMVRFIISGSVTNLFIVSALLFSNSVTFLFFDKQVKEAKGISQQKMKTKNVLLFLLLVLLFGVLGFFTAYYNVFNL